MTENEQFVSIDDGLDFSIKHIGSGEVFYDCDSVVDILNDQDMKIRQLEKVNEDLREVNKENQLLHEENVKQCERWRNLYELKDKEVTARVDALNRVCNYYLTETQFKAETDPNDAVKEVINEILNAPIYEE